MCPSELDWENELPEGVDDLPFPEITQVVAEAIIKATRHPSFSKQGYSASDVERLATALQDMMLEYSFRLSLENGLSIRDLNNLLQKMKKSLHQITNLIGGALLSGDVFELILVAGPVYPSIDDMELTHRKLSMITDELLPWLARRCDAAQKTLAAEQQGANPAARRLEFVEGSARAWLYDYGIPEAFTSFFGGTYRIGDAEGNPSAGGRFAEAVFASTGAPAVSLSALRQRQRLQRKRAVKG